MTAVHGTRNRGGWSQDSLAYVARVNDVLDELRDYWPLTLRQVYYQLVAAGFIPNESRQYTKLSRMLAKARLDGRVPWDAIEDRARATLASGGWDDQDSFVREELDRFLAGYRRDLLRSQPVALELWVEKDALSRICHRVAFEYCVAVIVARGFSSVSYVHECRKRVLANGERPTRILYFGDLDPSGWAMLPSMLETLQVEMQLGEHVEGIRCALTAEQVDEYDLPHSPDALKPKDTRAEKYVEQFGLMAVELDALPPATLEQLVREAIEDNLDVFRLEKEWEREKQERAALSTLRAQVQAFVEQRFS